MSYADACQAVLGATFVYPTATSGCFTIPATSDGCYPFVTFTDGNHFKTANGEVLMQGTYTCDGWSMRGTVTDPGATGVSFPGAYDPKTDTLTWDYGPFVRVDASTAKYLCPC